MQIEMHAYYRIPDSWKHDTLIPNHNHALIIHNQHINRTHINSKVQADSIHTACVQYRSQNIKSMKNITSKKAIK